jgi:hypothetical protein
MNLAAIIEVNLTCSSPRLPHGDAEARMRVVLVAIPALPPTEKTDDSPRGTIGLFQIELGKLFFS